MYVALSRIKIWMVFLSREKLKKLKIKADQDALDEYERLRKVAIFLKIKWYFQRDSELIAVIVEY